MFSCWNIAVLDKQRWFQDKGMNEERLEKTSLGTQGAVGPESKSWGKKRLISLNWNILLKMAQDPQRDVVPRLAWGHSMNFTIPWRHLGSRVYLLYRVLEKVKFDQLPGVILSRVLLGALSSIGHCFLFVQINALKALSCRVSFESVIFQSSVQAWTAALEQRSNLAWWNSWGYCRQKGFATDPSWC